MNFRYLLYKMELILAVLMKVVQIGVIIYKVACTNRLMTVFILTFVSFIICFPHS
jgi:hypothetical protein